VFGGGRGGVGEGGGWGGGGLKKKTKTKTYGVVFFVFFVVSGLFCVFFVGFFPPKMCVFLLSPWISRVFGKNKKMKIPCGL